MKPNYCYLILTIAACFSFSPFSSYASTLEAQLNLPLQQSQQTFNEGTLLKPGDRLRLTVVGFPELSGEQVVMADGGLQIPLAGYVNIWGMTPNEATAIISDALIPYVRRPQVSLAIETLSPTRVSITGEVIRSGPLILDTQQTAPNGAVTLSEVLSLAGGVTPQADIRKIMIRRNSYALISSSGSVLPQRQPMGIEEIEVDLWEAIQSGDLSVDISIYDRDEIIVPKANQSLGADQQALLSSTVAPNQISVNVGGEVNRPGIVDIPPASNVNSAVAAAGGLTIDGAASNIVLLRTSEEGTVENYIYELGESSIPLRHGDSIIVSQSTRSQTRNFLDIFSRVLLPFSFFLR